MNRRENREALFLLMYQSLFNDDSLSEIAEANIDEFELIAESDELDALIKKAEAVTAFAEKSDDIIAEYSKTRKLERIPRVSVAIMRVALYEMDCDEDVPDKVAINEAIELCKKYAEKQDCVFVSGVLGNYYREKNGTE
ncbi:MAG: transcription antitermination factor NusB [Oscillospiraceae bacterium]|nr:transcription antitermination factor NusB [Oscillospiraceae bacterium]